MKVCHQIDLEDLRAWKRTSKYWEQYIFYFILPFIIYFVLRYYLTEFISMLLPSHSPSDPWIHKYSIFIYLLNSFLSKIRRAQFLYAHGVSLLLHFGNPGKISFMNSWSVSFDHGCQSFFLAAAMKSYQTKDENH